MKNIDLQEYATSEHELSPDQLDLLLQESRNLHLSVEPVKGKKGKYNLKPGSTVGALEKGEMSILIRPKIGIPKLLSMICYILEVYKPQDKQFDFQKNEALPDLLALALIATARLAFGRGLLRGYVTEGDSLYTVRGRIQFGEQLRQRHGIMIPVEVRFDEFTEDILANRLVKAAAARLGRMTLRSSEARRGLGWMAAVLDNVSLLEYRRGDVPEVRFDRLNEHYRYVVGLARLILLHSEFESRRGDVRATGFLIDMNVLFQEFVTQALRQKLARASGRLLAEEKTFLDLKDTVEMYPDLSWWETDGTCSFVGDIKYKNISDYSLPNADLYQLLAYTTAHDLPSGMLIYAKGEAEATTYIVRFAGKQLEIFALDLAGTLEDILARLDRLACKIAPSLAVQESIF